MPSIQLNTEVVAPIPSVRQSMASAENPGVRRSIRKATRRSFTISGEGRASVHIVTLGILLTSSPMPTSSERQRALKDILEQRVLVIDGAMGTMIHAAPLSLEKDYLGRENCPEILNVTRPDVIQEIHREYLDAGADIIETNTFGGAPVALADNHLEDRAHELNFAAAKLARDVADRFSTPGKPRFVAGSMGPTNKDLNITGTATFAQLRDGYYTQAKGLVEGGADFLLVETCFDTGSLKAGLAAMS